MSSDNSNYEHTEHEYPQVERRVNSIPGIVIRFELLGVLLAIIVQTLTAVWWGATVTTKMDYMQQAIAGLKVELSTGMADRYTNKDAIRDFQIVKERINNNETRITFLERKNSNLTSKFS